VQGLLAEHIDLTRSAWARELRAHWEGTRARLVKVVSVEYQQLLERARIAKLSPPLAVAGHG